MDKEVKFTEKKIDQSWKEEVRREKGSPRPESSPAEPPAGLSFSAFLSSLGYQALFHLGEAPHPDTQERTINLDAAKETIDLLSLLQTKTQGNRTAEEDKLLKSLVAQLQMKFAEKVSAPG